MTIVEGDSHEGKTKKGRFAFLTRPIDRIGDELDRRYRVLGYDLARVWWRQNYCRALKANDFLRDKLLTGISKQGRPLNLVGSEDLWGVGLNLNDQDESLALVVVKSNEGGTAITGDIQVVFGDFLQSATGIESVISRENRFPNAPIRLQKVDELPYPIFGDTEYPFTIANLLLRFNITNINKLRIANGEFEEGYWNETTGLSA